MGVIRTPMPPVATLRDDPLRVLRCIRFASRYGFDIVPGLKSAVKDPIVQVAKPLNIFVNSSHEIVTRKIWSRKLLVKGLAMKLEK